MMTHCTLCPRRCGVDRRLKPGPCGGGERMKVAAVVLHRGEEPPLTEGAGSGAVFFSGCTLHCVFCQNRQISHGAWGVEVSSPELAGYLLELQRQDAANINLVTPAHYTPQVIESLDEARSRGLALPVVINSGGYETPETLEMWRDQADIYLLDLKYGDNATGQSLSSVRDYWDRAREALVAAYEQVGPLVCDDRGRAVRGVLVRHLVLPEMRSNPFAVLEFVAGVSAEIPVSIMAQYNPTFYEGESEALRRRITAEEYAVVVERACDLGIETLFTQELSAPEEYTPDFKAMRPFADMHNLLDQRNVEAVR